MERDRKMERERENEEREKGVSTEVAESVDVRVLHDGSREESEASFEVVLRPESFVDVCGRVSRKGKELR